MMPIKQVIARGIQVAFWGGMIAFVCTMVIINSGLLALLGLFGALVAFLIAAWLLGAAFTLLVDNAIGSFKRYAGIASAAFIIGSVFITGVGFMYVDMGLAIFKTLGFVALIITVFGSLIWANDNACERQEKKI